MCKGKQMRPVRMEIWRSKMRQGLHSCVIGGNLQHSDQKEKEKREEVWLRRHIFIPYSITCSTSDATFALHDTTKQMSWSLFYKCTDWGLESLKNVSSIIGWQINKTDTRLLITSLFHLERTLQERAEAWREKTGPSCLYLGDQTALERDSFIVGTGKKLPVLKSDYNAS